MPEISNRVSITVLPIRLVLLYSISFTLSYLNRSIWYFIYYWISIFKSSELKICQDLKSQVAELQNHKQSVVYHRTFVGHTRDLPQSITKNKKKCPGVSFSVVSYHQLLQTDRLASHFPSRYKYLVSLEWSEFWKWFSVLSFQAFLPQFLKEYVFKSNYCPFLPKFSPKNLLCLGQ